MQCKCEFFVAYARVFYNVKIIFLYLYCFTCYSIYMFCCLSLTPSSTCTLFVKLSSSPFPQSRSNKIFCVKGANHCDYFSALFVSFPAFKILDLLIWSSLFSAGTLCNKWLLISTLVFRLWFAHANIIIVSESRGGFFCFAGTFWHTLHCISSGCFTVKVTLCFANWRLFFNVNQQQHEQKVNAALTQCKESKPVNSEAYINEVMD